MKSRTELLRWEQLHLQHWFNAFDCQVRPRVQLEPTGQTLSILNFPLPQDYKPDRIDIALVVDAFPADPPKGLYILKRPECAAAISRLQRKFNIFQGKAFHGAPAISGFEWLCIGYLDGWRYHTGQPHKGDNIQKMLAEFWRHLEQS